MNSENEKRKHRCCFTGHRPEKLISGEKEISVRLEKAIKTAVNDGFTVFISGMARGVDIWAAEIVLRLRDSGTDIKLICACPFDGFEQSWSENWKRRYRSILSSADYVKYICTSYNGRCFQLRNEWMVNHSARLIAVFNGTPGGTKNTIAYAHKNMVPTIIIKA